MAKLAPIFNDAQLINGIPATGGLLFTYAAGSSTKQTTFTDQAGLIAQSNPIVLNARGEPAQPIWLTEGQGYKFVFSPATDSDPPVSPIRTIDNITGINDASLTIDQWVDSGLTPTYVNATQFTLPGDQSTAFHVGRRVKSSVTAGTAYGIIDSVAYTSLTTVTLTNDVGSALDSGLSSISYGLLTNTNDSLPLIAKNKADLSGAMFTGAVEVPDEAYGSGWNANLEVPTKNAVYDKIQTMFKDYISGLNPSTGGSSTTITFTDGSSADSTNTELILLNSSLAKTTSAWAVGTGNGGLDTGTIANNTWYHFYLIRRADTGVVDIVFSTNATSPTLPTNYTQFAYIDSWVTNGSAQWENCYVTGNNVFYKTHPQNATNATVGTSKELLTVSTPLGIKVIGVFNVYFSNSNTRILRVYSDEDTDAAASNANSTLFNTSASNNNNTQVIVSTNTSSQIALRCDASANGIYLQTAGYFRKRTR